jgi:hypothetical protein
VVAASAIVAHSAAADGAVNHIIFANEGTLMPIVHRMRSSFVLLCALALLVVADDGAFAQQPTQQQAAAIRSACRSDYMSHCSNVPTGGMEALQCLRDHVSALSPSCQTAVNAATPSPPPAAATPAPAQPKPPAPSSSASVPKLTPVQEAGLVRRSCGADFRSYCQGTQLGEGRAVRCLVQNESRLSPACKQGLAAARQGQ